ncbi:MAG: hypothetical protein V5A46_06595 [Haloferacaceae archaeon]
MTRYRLHVFPPDDDDVAADPTETEAKRERLRAAFDELFTESDAEPVQENTREWVSAVFEDPSERMADVEEFEQECERLYPEADVLRTRQDRKAMDGGDAGQSYDVALMLQVTHAIS